MATETFKKNYGNITCYSSLSWVSYGGIWYRNSGNSTGWNNFTMNLSVIPADAEIKSVIYSNTQTQTMSGSGEQWISRGEGDLYKTANSANIKNYLIAGNRSVRLVFSFQADTQADRRKSDGEPPYSASRTYRNVSIEITYESGNKTWLLHYGSGDEWKEVAARGAQDGEWKLVEAYMGVNGGWTLCERIDVGE